VLDECEAAHQYLHVHTAALSDSIRLLYLSLHLSVNGHDAIWRLPVGGRRVAFHPSVRPVREGSTPFAPQIAGGLGSPHPEAARPAVAGLPRCDHMTSSFCDLCHVPAADRKQSAFDTASR